MPLPIIWERRGSGKKWSARGRLKMNVIARGRAFEEDLIVADVDVDGILGARLHDPRRRKERLSLEKEGAKVTEVVLHGGHALKKKAVPKRKVYPPEPLEEVYNALVLGTRDYVKKNGFRHVVIGLSGGIDSSHMPEAVLF